MGLQTPLYLVGLLSAAIPLLIHLSRSRKTRTLRFSTTRFLTDQFLRSYRMSRLKELLLLAARMAMCALLAMTFAEPFMTGSVATGDPTRSRSVVIVLDDSASMLYRDTDGGTLLSRAAREASEIIKGLKPSDTASIVLAGRRANGPEAVYPEPTSDLAGIENWLLGLAEQANSAEGRREALGTDLPGAVLLAERMLDERDESSHEVYVFSDLQQRGLATPVLAGETQGSFDARVVFVPVRPTGPISNLAITAVQYGASRPMAGIPFSIRPHIRNDGQSAQPCTISLYVRAEADAEDADEEGFRKVAEQVVSEPLEPGRWSVHTLHHTFHKGGWQAGYVSVDAPRLTADNRRYFCFEVLDAVNVVAVNGAPSSIRRNDELFFLRAALAAGGAEISPIQVTSVRANAFQGASLDDVRLVILANVETLPEAAVGKLERYVDRGGSLLVFLGNQVEPSFYNDSLARSARGALLPAKLIGTAAKGNPAVGGDQAPVAGVGEFAEDHPALSGFVTGETGRLGSVKFSAYWGLEPVPSGRVLMATESGDPLLCEHTYGRGRVALFASSCDRDWTNLPVQPAFLPFVYRLVGHLAQSAGGQSAEPQAANTAATTTSSSSSNFFRTGQEIRQAVPVGSPSRRIQVIKPDRTVGVFEALSDPTLRQVSFSETEQPGIYRFEEAGSDGSRRAFAVNLEAGESDLRSIELTDENLADPTGPLAEALPWIGSKRLKVADDAVELGAQAGVGRSRSDLWEILMWIVLLIAILEPALANWITSKHYLKPRSDPRTIVVPTGHISLGGDLDALAEARESLEASETASQSSEPAEAPVSTST